MHHTTTDQGARPSGPPAAGPSGPSGPPAAGPSGPPAAPRDEQQPRRRGVFVILAVGALLLLALLLGVSSLRSTEKAAGERVREVDEAAAVTTTTEPTLPIITSTDAALALYVAWQRGDDVDADRAATAAAAEQMADIETISAAGLEFRGCAAPESGSSMCTWDREGARLSMEVAAPEDGAQPEVTSVAFTET